MWMFVLVVVVVLFKTWFQSRQHFKRILNKWDKMGIKYIPPAPLIGNMYPILSKKMTTPEFIQHLYSAFPNERYFGILQLTTPVLLLRDPKLIRDVMVKYFDNFVDHTNSYSVTCDPLWTKTLVARTGNDWRDVRHTVSPAFTSSKMKMMFVLMEKCAKRFVDHLETKQQKSVNLEMKDICERYTTDVIASAAFGIDCNSIDFSENEFLTHSKDLGDFTGIKRFKLFLFGFFPTISNLFKLRVVSNKVGKYFSAIIKDTIRIRQQKNIIRPDMIHLFMEARKGLLKHDNDSLSDNMQYASVQDTANSNSKSLLYLTDEDIISQALIFILGGYDTTSSAICTGAHELGVNPDVQSRLRRDLLEALEECNGKITYDALMKIKYLDMVVCECLRKWPQVFWLDRRCTKPFEIRPSRPDEKPVKVEVGDNIWLPAYALHRDPQYYPDPDKFDPERFNDENRSKIDPFTYLPFGQGPRSCIGNRFALMAFKVILFYMLTNFEIVPNVKTQNPLKLSKDSFFLMAEHGFHLAFNRLS